MSSTSKFEASEESVSFSSKAVQSTHMYVLTSYNNVLSSNIVLVALFFPHLSSNSIVQRVLICSSKLTFVVVVIISWCGREQTVKLVANVGERGSSIRIQSPTLLHHAIPAKQNQND